MEGVSHGVEVPIGFIKRADTLKEGAEVLIPRNIVPLSVDTVSLQEDNERKDKDRRYVSER